MTPGLSASPVDIVRELLSYPFMLNALRAGTIVAVVAGAVGYIMVLRRESFAGHTLAVVGFPGAAGAAWLGFSPVLGYFGAGILGAGAIGLLTRPGAGAAGGGGFGEESAVIGTVQAFALACGFLFVSLYQGFLGGVSSLLFGTITGVTTDQVLVLLGAGVVVLVVLTVLGRPLLFASVDPALARATGVPVRAVGVVFLLLLGIATAGTSQVTGSLLVFALLVAPAATATRLTTRPALGMALSVVVAVAVTWLGEAAAYFTVYPIGFWVTTLAFAAFLAATAWHAATDRLGRHHRAAPHPTTTIEVAAGAPG